MFFDHVDDPFANGEYAGGALNSSLGGAAARRDPAPFRGELSFFVLFKEPSPRFAGGIGIRA
ncbi:MAG: hypothetical protein HZB38_08935 [Planctomycetes bacterium]|nr:hypothetical protein [Planctomycetota bacterium]